MFFKQIRFLRLTICALFYLVFLSSCVSSLFGEFTTRDDYVITFDTAGNCATILGNRNYIKKGTLDTSTDFKKGLMHCSGNWDKFVSLSFDPTKIQNKDESYPENSDRIFFTELRISIGSEITAGVNLPGGICLGVAFESSSFSIEKNTRDDGYDEYTVKGNGQYWCQPQF